MILLALVAIGLVPEHISVQVTQIQVSTLNHTVAFSYVTTGYPTPGHGGPARPVCPFQSYSGSETIATCIVDDHNITRTITCTFTKDYDYEVTICSGYNTTSSS